MSHIVEAKTTIVNPNLNLLYQAVDLVSQQHQGSLKDHYVDYYGKRHKTNTAIALFTPDLIRGIGVDLGANGELTFVGDPWMAHEMFDQVQGEIVQTYVSLATMQAMQELGYTTQAEEAQGGRLVISGVNYA